MIERIEYSSESHENSYLLRNNIDKTLNMDIKVSILIRGRRVPSTEHIELRDNKMYLDSTTTKCLININEDLKQYGRDYEQD
jgi:hypothetical protein